MPRTPAENERIHQATREQILKAAMDLFLTKGYHATSIEDIAKQAQISKGLLYHYFKGKEDVLAALRRCAAQRSAVRHECRCCKANTC